MSATTTLSPKKVRKQMFALRYESGQIEEEIEEIKRRRCNNNQQIIALQDQCPHKNTREVSVQDVAEIKERTFCTDCGAQVRVKV